MNDNENQVVEARGEAAGEAAADGGFGIIVEAAGKAQGSAMRALRQMYESVNE
jgi:hypothetical protein